MEKYRSFHRKKLLVLATLYMIVIVGLCVRLGYVMIFEGEYYEEKAIELHERERSIKAARGKILDVNGEVLADNKTVCTISVIHLRKKVEKISAREKIASNVEKSIGDKIRNYDLDGVKVDEDFKRNYPYNTFASKVLGFTGGDNQGIIGLEVKYEAYLKGTNGMILTMTDAKGIELQEKGERRQEAVPGNNLRISIDKNIQMYAQQLAEKVRQKKNADRVEMIVMKPSNGEILAMVNVPEFNLNEPYTIDTDDVLYVAENEADQTQLLNKMWRNTCINDTYEPGSIFKVFTASAAFESHKVTF